ncbi:3-oxoacyl-ACP reductase [Thermoanaerobacterium sp. CMT5567-10]|uniref:3-oxoacyl-ACP reductase n=1 Tax=Thermoanaerobacterium sp. CMT5567-10 TaxID=3061989 RepID=UPI0026E0352F|nr:3-oxoacyl-ACP reductase [Thermoanaerobacterium sp. CMT5567-10]WKV09844.1 3-oxoacyl-ACP reductase [Thermoanaerobacterium sp. CMT5567-10]
MDKKVALITGGDKGIGKAIVEKLVKEGYYVCFTFLRNIEGAKIVETNNKNTRAFQCDVRDFSRVKEVSGMILDQFGKVDVLINNAGIVRDKTFLKMDRETWDVVIDTNLKSIYNFTHELLPIMINEKFGRIINISSVIGIKGGFGQTNYAASKAGIIGFTKSLALEVAKNGITVNAIAPGYIETDMTKEIPDNIRQELKKKISIGEFGKPIDIANLIAYLVREESYYITGEVFNINGGYY